MHLHYIFKHVMFLEYKCENLTLGLKGVITNRKTPFFDLS
jgi:hypothetical protein